MEWQETAGFRGSIWCREFGSLVCLKIPNILIIQFADYLISYRVSGIG